VVSWYVLVLAYVNPRDYDRERSSYSWAGSATQAYLVERSFSQRI
jgi:hypothetical protein